LTLSDEYHIAVLGGYGHFGGRIVRALSNDKKLRISVIGRDKIKAETLCAEIKLHKVTARLQPVALDHGAGDFSDRLQELGINLLIHTSGPYQNQGYGVARSCIQAGVHYLDLADGRAFVTGIHSLNSAAKERDLLVVTGASTLPALSSAVVDAYRERFSELGEIGISIAPGQNTPRGLATLAAVLSYCGKPFRVWQNRNWTYAYGWQGIYRSHYPRLGARWLARCDVPDLELFPSHYAPVNTVRFDAALELALAQWGFWFLSWLTRLRIIARPERFASFFLRAGRWMDRFGSNIGGMHVSLSGMDRQRRPMRLSWHLTAGSGHGPEIPIMAAIILARKLADRTCNLRGAYPCLSLITLDEFSAVMRHLDIEWKVTEENL
jgi:hypothetical protein